MWIQDPPKCPYIWSLRALTSRNFPWLLDVLSLCYNTDSRTFKGHIPHRYDQPKPHNSWEAFCTFVYEDLSDTQGLIAQRWWPFNACFILSSLWQKRPDDVELTGDNNRKMADLGKIQLSLWHFLDMYSLKSWVLGALTELVCSPTWFPLESTSILSFWLIPLGS